MTQAHIVPELVFTEPVLAVDDHNLVATLRRQTAKGTRQTPWDEHLRPLGRVREFICIDGLTAGVIDGLTAGVDDRQTANSHAKSVRAWGKCVWEQ